MVNSLRVFFIGGLISFRALFHWLSPWIFVPSLLVAPVFQILFFVYLGRSAGLGSDKFFLIGNALQYVAVPCLFATANVVAGERFTQTLGLVLISPAGRVAVFLGRALPIMVMGCVVAVFSLSVGALLVGVHIPMESWPSILLAIVVASASCTGLGMVNAAWALRVRETAVLSNILFGVLLIFCSVNVPSDQLPGWMAEVGQWLPLTHAVEAARATAGGAELGSVSTLMIKEGCLAVAYLVLGLMSITALERHTRRTASLERL